MLCYCVISIMLYNYRPANRLIRQVGLLFSKKKKKVADQVTELKHFLILNMNKSRPFTSSNEWPFFIAKAWLLLSLQPYSNSSDFREVREIEDCLSFCTHCWSVSYWEAYRGDCNSWHNLIWSVVLRLWEQVLLSPKHWSFITVPALFKKYLSICPTLVTFMSRG